MIHYRKDAASKIAYVTFDCPERFNAISAQMKRKFDDILFRANIDDDVKVLVLRGEGAHFGTGGDVRDDAIFVDTDALQYELGLDDGDVTYPPPESFRFLYNITANQSRSTAGTPLQEFKKISIVEAKGYCYGMHFFYAVDADLVIASDDALFGHPAFRYAGFAPRFWAWCEALGQRRFSEMLFTGRPFTAAEMKRAGCINSLVGRDALERETEKWAQVCAARLSTDAVVAYKTAIQIQGLYRGEYLGGVLTGLATGTFRALRNDSPQQVELDAATSAYGINNAVKDLDDLYPPEWRLSLGKRRKP